MPVDCPCQSAGVADHQAALRFTAWDNSFVLQDFNSPHGTFVNGCQVQNAAVKVSPGDILRFGAGGASFELVVDGAAQVRMEGDAQVQVGAAAPQEQDQAPRLIWVISGKAKGGKRKSWSSLCCRNSGSSVGKKEKPRTGFPTAIWT